MIDDPQAPTWLARRRRLTDKQTEQRMLDAAVAMVSRSGLTLSFDNLSLEDVIRDAQVSRSAAYRRWPYKDLFFSDLLKTLARATQLANVGNDGGQVLVERFLLDNLDGLGSAEGRHDLAVELVRQGSLQDFETVYRSTEWRTYYALNVTFLGLPIGDLRNEVQAALAATEKGFIDRVSAANERMASLLGYRLRAGTGATFQTVATLGLATIAGHVIKALVAPEVATGRFVANPFGSTQAAEWSLPAIGLAIIAWTFLEPDPDVEWNEERIVWIRSVLE